MIDVMKRALKVLENKKLRMDEHLIPIVVDDLRQAIEQAEKEATLQEISDIGQEIEQEPFAVAWALNGELFWPFEYEVIAQEGDGAQPLYAVSPKREIEQAHTDHPMRHWDRTCPACVKEAEKQEPVAYVNNDGFIVEKDFDIAPGEKLYLAPPKREWVGLTHEEIRDAYEQCMPEDVLFARAIEDKLREKNT